MKIVVLHFACCTGCRTSELYFAAERGNNMKIQLMAVQVIPLHLSRARVEGSSAVPVSMQYRQGRQAPCLEACLAGALVCDS